MSGAGVAGAVHTVAAENLWLIYPASKPVARLLLCHGAGAPVQSDFLTQLAKSIALLGIEVWSRNFAYMQKTLQGHKQPPSKMPLLQQELQHWLAELPTDLPIVLAGKSMGGRVATLLLAENHSQVSQVAGMVVYGYPFRPPAKKMLPLSDLALVSRIGHLPKLAVPTLILQGQRDAFGGPELVTAEQLATWPQIQLQWLAGGDHDYLTLKKHPCTQSMLIQQAAQATREFIDAKILAS
jgi:hypothetical protein